MTNLFYLKKKKRSRRKMNNKKIYIFDISLLSIILIIAFVLLEIKHPFYFLSDDNRTFYLPQFIHNFRAITNGEIAFYNFHQYLGIAHFSNFQSAIFYPLTYFSMFLSKISSGHEFWTIDIAVLFHFIIGSIGFYKLITYFIDDRYSAIFGGLVWTLNSFNIFVSNSWWVFSGVTAYFPWILLFGFKLYYRGNYKHLFLLVMFRLLLFYVGHIEYFIHCMIFELLTVSLFILSLNSGKSTLAFIKKYAISYPITLIYTLPILLPAWVTTKTSGLRNQRLSNSALSANGLNFSSWIQSLINPFNLDTDFYLRSQNKFSIDTFPHLAHIGYISILLIFFCIIYSSINKNFRKYKTLKVTLSVLFILSLVWASGWMAGILSFIPILNRFRFPFKLLAFSNFYLIFVASFGFYFLIKIITKNILKIIVRALLILLSLINFYLLYNNVYVSFNNRDHIDNLPLKESHSDEFKNGRIFSMGISENDPFSVSTLGFNYATLLDLNHFAGYDPLMPKKNFDACLNMKYRSSYRKRKLPIDYLRDWGVDWYILNKDTLFSSLNSHYDMILSKDSDISKFSEAKERIIYLDRKANPLVYWRSSGTAKDIKFEMRTNSILIHTNNLIDDHLIINYLNNDFFKAKLKDQKNVPIDETSIGQMKVLIPKGENKLKITYRNTYYVIGIIVVCIFSALFIFLLIWNKFYRKKVN
jgi:hypothetical protein